MLALTIHGETETVSDDQQYEAMKRYWEARQSGDPTAKLVLVKDETDDDPDDPPPTPAGAVSTTALTRIERQEEWLDRNGFHIGPPLYAPGTRVLPLGDQNFHLERKRVEAMPLFGDAAMAVNYRVLKEERRDVDVPMSAVHMEEDGRLRAGDEVLEMETGAFYQLAVLGDFGLGGRYLAEACDPALRALNVNVQMAKMNGRPLRLRTRKAMEGRRIFATVTPTYAPVDTDRVLDVVADELSDAHTEMVYDGTGVRATALWMPDQVQDLAAGDIFKTGVRIETDDTGRGRIRVTGVAFRNMCLNLIIIEEGEVETVNLVHRGDPDRILEIVRGGVAQARAKVSDFLEAWGYARTVKVKVEETIRQWVMERKIQVKGVRSAEERDAVVEVLLTAWRAEPGNTLADAANAVSRAAHEHPLWDVAVREELERQAARLVLVPR